MTGSTLAEWAALCLLLVLASAAGVSIAARLPWSGPARESGWSLAVGLGLGPFLSGLLTVGVLGILPGASHGLHLSIVLTGLFLLAISAPRQHARGPGEVATVPHGSRLAPRAFMLLAAAWSLALVIGTVLTPLTQNDALEYATVGRILFETRDLSGSPPINPGAYQSGFYHPWTHPPLYVAMIYLAHLLQGDADSPGLMRMIAPWCALAAAFLVYRLGSRMGQVAGAAAAILFISTPLFFLGAIAGLIDGLPILGSALVLALVTGLGAGPAARGLLCGTALGAALWTHSQAILLLPLTAISVALYRGLSDRRGVAIELFAAFAMAAALGCWPYLRNLWLLGSAISDNPAVFALPRQAWPEYFTIMRGVEHAGAVIQYGVLKGFFSLEAYSITFWAMLVGAIQYVALRKRDHGPILTRPGVDPADPSGIVRTSLGLVVCYVGGVVLSILIGMDIMVKNERYMLIILPAVALVFAFSLRGSQRSMGGRMLAGAFVGIATAQLVGLSTYVFSTSGIDLRAAAFDTDSALRAQPEFAAVRYLAGATDSKSLVLTLKPADMYYSGRRMMSYLDPRLVPFYAEREPRQAAEFLHKLGITHIHVPDHHLPPVYNSALQDLLRDPQLSTLEFSDGGYQVYALRPSNLRPVQVIDMTPGAIEWKRSANLILGGRKALGRIALRQGPLLPGAISTGGLPLGFFDRDTSTTLSSVPVAVDPDCEYGLDIHVDGRGAVRAWLLERAAAHPRDMSRRSPVPAQRTPIGDFFLSPDQPGRSLAYRVRTKATTHSISLELEHLGRSQLDVHRVVLVHLANPAEPKPTGTHTDSDAVRKPR